jgi:hypothetical protein
VCTSAERIDRLLGVADQHQRRPALAEGTVHDVPLNWVRVLELVDQHDVIALTQTCAGGGAPRIVEERRTKATEHVVIGEDLARLLPVLHLLAHRLGEAAPDGRQVIRLRQGRHHVGVRVPERGFGDLHGVAAVEVERVGLVGEAA